MKKEPFDWKAVYRVGRQGGTALKEAMENLVKSIYESKKEVSRTELNVERKTSKLAVTDKKKAENVIKILNQFIKELEKGAVSQKTVKKFNEEVAKDEQEIMEGLIALQQYEENLTALETKELNEIQEIADTIRYVEDTLQKWPGVSHDPIDIEWFNESKKDVQELKESISTELNITRSSMQNELSAIKTETKEYPTYISEGVKWYTQYINTRAPGDARNAIVQLEGAKKILESMVKAFDNLKDLAKQRTRLTKNSLRKKVEIRLRLTLLLRRFMSDKKKYDKLNK
jgi:hypothetical protein